MFENGFPLELLFLGFLAVMIIMRIANKGACPLTLRQAESPLDILKRRYASGEITHEEYEERSAHLR